MTKLLAFIAAMSLGAPVMAQESQLMFSGSEGYPNEEMCSRLATVALAGAALGNEMDYVDPAIDAVLEMFGEYGPEAVNALTWGYSHGVMGVQPEIVGFVYAEECMSVPA